jgi:MFS family permease
LTGAAAGLRRWTSATSLLFVVALVEELSSGVPSSGAPDIERGLALSHTATAAVLFSLPGIVSFVLDPVVFVLADRFGRAPLARAGLAAMALAFAVAAVAPGPVTLACAMAVWHTATGTASLTEATLVDLWPERRARTLARWSLMAMLGDLAAPVLLGALALLGVGAAGWRVAFGVVGGFVALLALAVTLRPYPAPAASPDEDEPTLWQAVRDALRDRTLIAWLFGMELCNLLDEVLVVFATIRVRDELGGSPLWQSATVGAFVAGGIVGLVALERLLVRHAERRLLIASGLACAALFLAWLLAPAPWLAAALMFPVGVTTAPLYPLATAQAYARRPERTGIIVVASHVFAPFALALPWLLGLAADRFGVPAALALLIAQPVGLVILAAATTGGLDSRGSRTGGGS